MLERGGGLTVWSVLLTSIHIKGLCHIRYKLQDIFHSVGGYSCFSKFALSLTTESVPDDLLRLKSRETLHVLCNRLFDVFRRKLSQLGFDLHFCIMTSVWDFSNPPFYWMIS